MFNWFGKVSYVTYSKVADFAGYLKDGRMMGSLCQECGHKTFPPRADCPMCLSDKFNFEEYNGTGIVFTYSTISAAPAGFEDMTPYTVVVVSLNQGGRLAGWLGESIQVSELCIGMPVQVVPQIFEETPEIKVYYTIEKTGTTWSKAPVPNNPLLK